MTSKLKGCGFEDKAKACSESNSIRRALKEFSSLNDKCINPLNDLRNSLAHNFGLCTEAKYNNGKDRKHRHKFTLDFSDKAEVVTLPITEWDGNYDLKKDEATSTVIGVFALCELAEDIIKKVYECYNQKELTLRVSENEARARFTILI